MVHLHYACKSGEGIRGAVKSFENKHLEEGLTAHAVYVENVSMTRASIVTALRDKLCVVTQNTVSPKRNLDEHEARYKAGAHYKAGALASEIYLLTVLSNTRFAFDEYFGWIFFKLET